MYGCASVHTVCMCRFVMLSSLCLVMSGLVCVRGGRLHMILMSFFWILMSGFMYAAFDFSVPHTVVWPMRCG
jgi:hypothetical protein